MGKRRPAGDGMVRRRKDGRWEGRIVIGHKNNGSPIFRYVSAKTQKELLKKLHQSMEEYQGVDLSEESKMPLSQWLDRWLEEYAAPSVRPSTLEGYRGYINRNIKPYLGNKPVGKITADDVRKLYRELQRNGRQEYHPEHGHKLSGGTIRRIHGVFHEAMDAAVRENLIPRNPTEGITLPKKKTAPKQILNDAQLEKFMEVIRELLALRWDDLDFTTGKLRIDKQVCPVGGKLVISEPKTKAANRTIILPPAMVDLLAEYKKGVFSDLMFPSRTKPDQPIDPGYVRKRLQAILKRAECKKVRFHDLRHTFATLSLENGMDVKTLSTIIGHVSSETTLNTYTHITDEMRRKAALSIDQGIAKAEVQPLPEEEHEGPERESFTPVQPTRRRPGAGSVSRINDHLWEGRYSPVWPDGKKRPRNVYAPTEEDCEEKLTELIREMNGEIAALRSGASTEYPEDVNPKKKAIADYLRENPGVTNKAKIARELHMSRPTVQRYYDEVRAEVQRLN